jgi:hypothetical protein
MTFFYRQRAERFAQLLEANSRRRHHVRSRADDDLSELVTVAHRVRAVEPSAGVNPEFRAGLRAMLIATAEREGIGATASDDVVPEKPSRRSSTTASARDVFHPAFNGRRARARGAILVGVAAGAIAVSGMSAASENAMPGDPLYGMKRSTERAQLALASSDLSRGQLFLDFARTRLAEGQAVRDDSLGFASVLDDMDAETRHGVRLLTTSAMQRGDEAALDAIGTFLTGQRRQVSGLLDGAGRPERDRASASLALLDSIKKRADGLRTALRCGADPATRADALGPLPQGCTGGKAPSGGQPTPAQDQQRPAGRATSSPRTESTHPTGPAIQPGNTPTTPIGRGNVPGLVDVLRPSD